jgi:hypothetical protein
VCSQDYLHALSEGDIADHSPFERFGFNPDIDATTADVWNPRGLHVFPTSADQWEVVSSDNVQDITTSIFGNGMGAAQTVQSDDTGTTTTLDDVSVDFTAGTPAAVGDILLLDPVGDSPEWGYITAVTATRLTCSNGFSDGGTGASRYYTVLDKSPKTGCLAVFVQYLDTSFVVHEVILALNGTTAVTAKDSSGNALSNFYRVNAFRVIATGSNLAPVGNITLRIKTGGATQSQIAAGQNRSRNSMYTVPSGRTLYVTSFGAGAIGNTSGMDATVTVLASEFPDHNFRLPFMTACAEVSVQDGSFLRPFEVPLKFGEGCDIKCRATVGNNNTKVSTSLRGWLE